MGKSLALEHGRLFSEDFGNGVLYLQGRRETEAHLHLSISQSFRFKWRLKCKLYKGNEPFPDSEHDSIENR